MVHDMIIIQYYSKFQRTIWNHCTSTVLLYQLELYLIFQHACSGKGQQEVKGQLVSLATHTHCMKLFTFTLKLFKTVQTCDQIPKELHVYRSRNCIFKSDCCDWLMLNANQCNYKYAQNVYWFCAQYASCIMRL